MLVALPHKIILQFPWGTSMNRHLLYSGCFPCFPSSPLDAEIITLKVLSGITFFIPVGVYGSSHMVLWHPSPVHGIGYLHFCSESVCCQEVTVPISSSSFSSSFSSAPSTSTEPWRWGFMVEVKESFSDLGHPLLYPGHDAHTYRILSSKISFSQCLWLPFFQNRSCENTRK